MVKIMQVGIGQKSSGTLDGITYYVRGGVSYARAASKMPASAYNTPAAKKRQAVFKFIQMHLKFHLKTIRQTFTSKGNGNPSNRYYSLNNRSLTAALGDLAEKYCAGQLNILLLSRLRARRDITKCILLVLGLMLSP